MKVRISTIGGDLHILELSQRELEKLLHTFKNGGIFDWELISDVVGTQAHHIDMRHVEHINVEREAPKV
jgi:hypothetical protein